MKRHYWQYLIDSAGNAVEGARIHVYLAGSSTYANIYTTESGEPVTTEFTEILTDNNGYFDFWMADLTTSPLYGYSHTQRFTITWSKPGLVSGGISNIDIIYPTLASSLLQLGTLNETLSVEASATEYFEISDFCNRALVYELDISSTSEDYDFDLEFFRNGTYSSSQLQYKIENITNDFNDKLPFYLRDITNEQKLWAKITNYSNAVEINLKLYYEEFSPQEIIGFDGSGAGGSSKEIYNFTDIEVSGGESKTFELSDFCNRALVYYISIEEVLGLITSYDFKIYSNDNYSDDDILYSLEDVDAATIWIDRAPFYYEDENVESRLYLKVTNTDIETMNLSVIIKAEVFA